MEKPPDAVWQSVTGVGRRNWTCGYCGRGVGANMGYRALTGQAQAVEYSIYPCPHCAKPTFFEGDRQTPGAAYGNTVNNLPPDVGSLYQEARNCMVVSAYTSAVLTCRKILMHIAVEKGASAGQSFVEYVRHLITANLIPQHFQTWVDQIRQKSNEANHEIVIMGTKEAEDLLSFTEMLLKVLYEYPNRAAPAAGP